MRSQTNVWFLWFGDEGRQTACVQLFQRFWWRMSLTYLVQYFDERHVLLSIDMIQLNGHIVYLLQCLRTKEVRCVVIGFENLFVFWRNNGSQLCQVANHQQLYSSKRLVVVTKTSKYCINGVQQVCTYHTNLINNQEVYGSNDLSLLTSKVKLAL